MTNKKLRQSFMKKTDTIITDENIPKEQETKKKENATINIIGYVSTIKTLKMNI